MKKRLRNFLTGVGSVLDISPNVKKEDFHIISRKRHDVSDIEVIRKDVHVVGKDFVDRIYKCSKENTADQKHYKALYEIVIRDWTEDQQVSLLRELFNNLDDGVLIRYSTESGASSLRLSTYVNAIAESKFENEHDLDLEHSNEKIEN